METVDLTVGDYPTNNTKNVYDWISDLCLTTYDKNILLDSNEWVCDTIVDAAQTLLKKQFPQIQSLQSVTLNLVVKFRIPTEEFLQVIHCNNHWFTISTIGIDKAPIVKVCDSVYSSIESMGVAQIACLLHTSEDSFEVRIINVQKQVFHRHCNL